MYTLEAQIFPEQSHDAVLFWDCSVLSKILGVHVVSSTVLNGHTHLLRFETEKASHDVLDKFDNMKVGEGTTMKLRQYSKSIQNPPCVQSTRDDRQGSVFLYQGDSGTRLVIELADALNLRVDSLVYPANETFVFDGGLAKHIAQSAGPKFVDEVRSRLQQSVRAPTIGDAFITESGLLATSTSITSIVHALIPYYAHEDKLRLMASAVRNALCYADDWGARSVGMTVMGSGNFGWPEHAASASIVDAIVKCLSDGALRSVREVRIFDQDPAKIAAVLRHVRTNCAATLVPASAQPPAAVRAPRHHAGPPPPRWTAMIWRKAAGQCAQRASGSAEGPSRAARRGAGSGHKCPPLQHAVPASPTLALADGTDDGWMGPPLHTHTA
jgi:O-acetyl-ADP-ribose deacetylase (regulator of RNase III)